MSVDFLLPPQLFDYFTLKVLKHNTGIKNYGKIIEIN